MNKSPTPSEPFQLGYKMPAEWELHEGTWISWPKDPDTFPVGQIRDGAEKTFAEMIKALQQHEKIFLLVNDTKAETHVRKKLTEHGAGTNNVIFHHIKSIDVWTRDYAPIFVKNNEGKVAAIRWIFNAWGNKWADLLPDNETGDKIADVVRATGMQIFRPGIVLEGGSIDTNGKGVFLTTEQCLLNKNRNPHLSRAQIESYLHNYLGAKKIIWLKDGVAGDDTDGHVDDFARFVNENTVVCAMEDDPNDENHAPLKENFELLKRTGLNVVALPMPRRIDCPERRLPISYANFYIGNGVVLLPIFDDPNDEKAKSIMQKLFPDRKVVQIPAVDLVYGYGGIHCATQQQPVTFSF